ncbi:hypothetical protein N8315_02960 [Octadecabacter sp.]|nr:hypothetical protein [Octadecabacter sp.]
MSNMKTEYNFENDIVIANYAYKQCENFIRSVEQKNENNFKNDLASNETYEDLYSECVDGFDYYIVGKVLSMAEHRRASFEQYVEDLATDKSDRNERAYTWLMMNAVYENYTMFVLEQFKQAYITKDEDADVWNGFGSWIQSTRNDDGTFTFFADTEQQLVVR